MSLITLQSLQQFPTKGDSQVRGSALEGHRPVGHSHFWERAIARRQFLTTAAGTFGLVLGSGVLGSGLWSPQLARAANPADPKPIPGGIQPFGPGTEVFHIFLPDPGSEPSLITDFHGFVGLAHITGFGTRTNASTGATSRVSFDNDVRFMKGPYIGVDGKQRNGTFVFF
ncbi:MAG TPA: hypothetical protein VKK81_08050 [Candidatus Binatia bacterium]|nr:hypothetical protein [Candidatus Binatia bacterium]